MRTFIAILAFLTVYYFFVAFIGLKLTAPKPIQPTVDSSISKEEFAFSEAQNTSFDVSDVSPGETLIIPSASLKQTTSESLIGFIVIHEEKIDTTKGAIIGYSGYLLPGYYTNLSIPLSRPIKSGEKLTAILHEDVDQSTLFDPDTDLPLTDSSGQTIQKTFTVK